MKKVKKKIEYKGLKILLYDWINNERASVKSNIEAFDDNGELLWIAENCPIGGYWEMQIDEENDTIEANDGSAMFYDIELESGKIINRHFRK